MKKTTHLALMIASLTIGTQALAHGPAAKQASAAIEHATDLFVKTQPTEVRRQFLAVDAIQTGHEQFAVTITLKDKTTLFKYDCVENEDVDPVVWECKAL